MRQAGFVWTYITTATEVAQEEANSKHSPALMLLYLVYELEMIFSSSRGSFVHVVRFS